MFIQHKVDTLDTSDNHKKTILANLDILKDEIDNIKENDMVNYKKIDILFRLCGSFLGFYQGCCIYSLTYWQTLEQHYTENIKKSGEDLLENCYKKITDSFEGKNN
jgi:hypothetical protein